MTVVNVPDSRNNFLTSPLLKKSTIEKGVQCITCQGTIKNFILTPSNKKTVNQAFYDTLSELVSNNQL